MFKRVAIGLLVLGAIVILGLGGFVIYQNQQLKPKVEEFLNQKLEEFSTKMEEVHLKAEFEPFKCGGLIYLGCKSPKISLFNMERKVAEVGELGFAIGGFNLDGVDLDLKFDFKAFVGGQEQGLVDALVPHQAKINVVASKKQGEILQVKTKLDLKANDIKYQMDGVEEFLIPQLQTTPILTLFQQDEVFLKQLRVLNFKLTLLAKDLKSVVIGLMQAQNPTFDEAQYQKLIQNMSAIAPIMSDDLLRPFVIDVINGITPFLLGKKEKFSIDVKIKEGATMTWDRDRPMDSILFEEFIRSYNYQVK